MPAETATEQTAPVPPPAAGGANGAAPTEPAPAPSPPQGTDAGGAAAPGGTEQPGTEQPSGATPTPDLDLSSDDGIKAALEKHPHLRSYIEHESKNAVNIHAQRQEAERRRQNASDEALQHRTDQFVTALGGQPGNMTRQQRADASTILQDMNYRGRVEALEALTEQITGSWNIPVEGREAMIAARERNDIESMTKIALSWGAWSHVLNSTLDDLEKQGLPGDSKLMKSIEARVKAAEAAETGAQQAQQRSQAMGATPPATPSGRGSANPPIEPRTVAEAAAAFQAGQITKDQYREARTKLPAGYGPPARNDGF